MFEEPESPLKPKGPKLLDALSIAELEDYIVMLETEIDRVHSAITAKKAHGAAADFIFRKQE